MAGKTETAPEFNAEMFAALKIMSESVDGGDMTLKELADVYLPLLAEGFYAIDYAKVPSGNDGSYSTRVSSPVQITFDLNDDSRVVFSRQLF